ncbi:hypothetical protein BS47DRAFT_403780 [Hydnum rufescens UP504]|uniref:Uncharacterized protein n=1 Tax=Hydnum rufescens UP504 TaxID=1448309 RepID=A0A9P6BAY6_9AGAM|nr:hypothetical protein BS47DRAFT_403780 [Hydnum rufescens UP504]
MLKLIRDYSRRFNLGSGVEKDMRAAMDRVWRVVVDLDGGTRTGAAITMQMSRNHRIRPSDDTPPRIPSELTTILEVSRIAFITPLLRFPSPAYQYPQIFGLCSLMHYVFFVYSYIPPFFSLLSSFLHPILLTQL